MSYGCVWTITDPDGTTRQESVGDSTVGTLTTDGDVTVGDDLVVTDDASVGGDHVTTGDSKAGRFAPSAVVSFEDGDATPSVTGSNVFLTANTALTSITGFDGGLAGQKITVVIGDEFTTVDFTSATLKGNGGKKWYPKTGDHMVCTLRGTAWYCELSHNVAGIFPRNPYTRGD